MILHAVPPYDCMEASDLAGITLDQAETQLAAWLAASLAIATNQSYSIAGRSYTRADAQYVESMVTLWDRRVNSWSRGGIRVRGATPTDG